MTKLSVNINKVATIRNARGGNIPNVLQVALDCERFGAQGITVHPRPDERHIRYADVRALKQVLSTEFNIEGNPIPSFVDLVLEVQPAQVTLVPDAPDALTSDAGWEVAQHFQFLRDTIRRFEAEGIRTSIFVGTDLDNIARAADTGCRRVELYTEPYATAAACGLEVNAGHDLNLDNLNFFARRVQPLAEVSIGHALISDALYLGLEETIRRYRHELIL